MEGRPWRPKECYHVKSELERIQCSDVINLDRCKCMKRCVFSLDLFCLNKDKSLHVKHANFWISLSYIRTSHDIFQILSAFALFSRGEDETSVRCHPELVRDIDASHESLS